MSMIIRLARAAALVVAAGFASAAAQTATRVQTQPPPQIHNRTLTTVTESGRQVFRLDARAGDGVAWWPATAFTTGTIELDVRGRDVPQASFVGVAFHGVDATTYEAIYFRPFNFRSDDAARRLRAVQYISHPAHPWQTLREQHPGVYEKPVAPPPDPDAWFHVTVRVEPTTVKVFVDGAASPALEVTRLTDRATGWVGIWVGNGAPGDFANVTITPRGPSSAPASAASAAAVPAVRRPDLPSPVAFPNETVRHSFWDTTGV